jgi:ribosomal protein S18 acetylase RimI-like enzyme
MGRRCRLAVAMAELPDDLGLGLRTDLMLLQGSARIEVRPDAVAVVSPGNPDFYFGNVLMPRTVPAMDAIPMWRACFADRIGRHPGIHHESFAWCARGAGDAVAQAWRDAGFEVSRSVVLACNPEGLKAPPSPRAAMALRPARRIDLPSLWRLYAGFERELHGGVLPPAQRRFLRGRFADFAQRVQAGAGDWHLAVVEGRPAAALGLFLHAGIGRFQEVLTDARFRRRGLCSALVYGAAVQAGTQGARSLVMVAEPSSAAIGLYRRLGFRDTEEVITACKVS